MIQFSIRELLALACLGALGMLMWRTRSDALQNAERLAEVRGQVFVLEDQAWVKRPEVHEAMLNTRDEFSSLREIRERALLHFDDLQEKYSAIELQGPDVLSLRGVPTMQIGSESLPFVYRLVVPESRPVWLKYGVHNLEPRVDRSRLDEAELLTDSPIKRSGPYAVRLEPGDHRLSVSTSRVPGNLAIEIVLDNQPLLTTAYVHSAVSGTSRISVSGQLQIDYPPNRPLPWLATSRIGLRPGNTGATKKVHGFSLWLSETSSDFEAFPQP